MSGTVVLRNTNPLGYVDVPILRREGPAPSFAECARCGPDADPDHKHREILDAEHGDPGSGSLVPEEEFETTPEIAGYPPAEDGSHPGIGLLAQVGNYEYVSGDLLEPELEDEDDETPYPRGVPNNAWRRPELDAYAADHEIDLAGVSKKGDALALILTALEHATPEED